MTDIAKPVQMLWEHINKDPLEEDAYFLLDDIARAVNAKWGEFHNKLFRPDGKPKPLYIDFVSELAKAIEPPVGGSSYRLTPKPWAHDSISGTGMAVIYAPNNSVMDKTQIRRARGSIEFMAWPYTDEKNARKVRERLREDGIDPNKNKEK